MELSQDLCLFLRFNFIRLFLRMQSVFRQSEIETISLQTEAKWQTTINKWLSNKKIQIPYICLLFIKIWALSLLLGKLTQPLPLFAKSMNYTEFNWAIESFHCVTWEYE